MYATPQDMVKKFGETEYCALANISHVDASDDGVMAYALQAASDEIDGYIGGRYTLPLVTHPPILTGIACDVARYRLTGNEHPCTDDIRERYQLAVRYLEKVARGDVTLGAAVSGGTAVGSSPSTVMFTSGGNNWSRGRTGGGCY